MFQIAAAMPILLAMLASPAYSQDTSNPQAEAREQLEYAREEANKSGASPATILRDLVTNSATGTITSQLSTSVLGLNQSAFVNTNAPERFGTAPNVEKADSFQGNVTRSFEEASTRPNYLRVWHGIRVPQPDRYLDTVMLVGNGSLCSGSLLTPTLVLTAAHCFCRGVTETAVVGSSSLHIVLTSKVDRGRSVSHIPCDDLRTADDIAANIGRGDYALLTLMNSVDGVALRKIASAEMVRNAASVRAVGFGKTPEFIGGVKFLVDIIIASYDCSEATISSGGAYRCSPPAEMIAAGMSRDTCGGDSGGPVYVLGADEKLYLAAVTSRSVDPTGSCGPGGIYVKLMMEESREWLVANGVPSSVFAE